MKKYLKLNALSINKLDIFETISNKIYEIFLHDFSEIIEQNLWSIFSNWLNWFEFKLYVSFI